MIVHVSPFDFAFWFVGVSICTASAVLTLVVVVYAAQLRFKEWRDARLVRLDWGRRCR